MKCVLTVVCNLVRALVLSAGAVCKLRTVNSISVTVKSGIAA